MVRRPRHSRVTRLEQWSYWQDELGNYPEDIDGVADARHLKKGKSSAPSHRHKQHDQGGSFSAELASEYQQVAATKDSAQMLPGVLRDQGL